MKIEKAIEILTAIVQTGQYEGDPDDSDATKLGIEALKREKANREDPNYVRVGTLPGEDTN